MFIYNCIRGSRYFFSVGGTRDNFVCVCVGEGGVVGDTRPVFDSFTM